MEEGQLRNAIQFLLFSTWITKKMHLPGLLFCDQLELTKIGGVKGQLAKGIPFFQPYLLWFLTGHVSRKSSKLV